MTSRRFQLTQPAPTPVAAEHWTIDAACRGEDPELFHIPGTDETKWHSPVNAERRALAAAICADCPVAAQCLAGAYDEDDRHGFRGGLTPMERTRLRTKQRKATA